MSADVVAVLREAREQILDPAQWSQAGWFFESDAWDEMDSSTCPVCVVGAVMRVRGNRDPWAWRAWPEIHALEAVVLEYLPRWNDAKETSHADVLDAFDRVIAAAEAAA